MLWRAIPFSYDIPFGQQASISDLWLSRSRCCPLSIQIVELDDHMRVAEVVSAVIHRRARWEHLKLSLVQWTSHLSAIEGPMPLLQHLDLSVEGDSYPTVVLSFAEAPLLRTAILNDIAATHVILPWAQLISLTLNRVFPRECLPILKQTTNLVHCELRLYLEDMIPLPDIILPSLESLVLKDPGTLPLTGYLHTFIVPALRRLEISERSLELRPIDPLKSLALFTSKSGCKLQELCITGQRTVSKHSYRREFPSIQMFSFTDLYDVDGQPVSEVEDDSHSSRSNSLHDFPYVPFISSYSHSSPCVRVPSQ
jgi:hypothetical protein